jgi:hypothetical protein
MLSSLLTAPVIAMQEEADDSAGARVISAVSFCQNPCHWDLDFRKLLERVHPNRHWTIIQNLLEKANGGMRIPQDILMGMNYYGEDFNGEGNLQLKLINQPAFLVDFEERCLKNPAYAYFALTNDWRIIVRTCTHVTDEQLANKTEESPFAVRFVHKLNTSYAAIDTCPEEEKKKYVDDVYNLGVLCYRIKERRVNCITIWEKAAGAGHAKAAYELGLSYEGCYGTPFPITYDKEKAASYFLQAADAGDLGAMFFLYSYYSQKEDSKQQSDFWLQKAADRGHSTAIDLLEVRNKKAL